MSVADVLISSVIWVLQNTILKILPNEFSFLPFGQFERDLQNLSPDLILAFNGINSIFPIKLLLGVILVIVAGEILLFSIKAMFWLANMVRGAGA